MVMAMMAVLVVILIVLVAGGIVVRKAAVMMVMIMGMKTRDGHIFSCMTMQPGRRCPGELERNDEHDDQDDEATHGGHSTEISVEYAISRAGG